ncbi:shikimate kinase [Frigoribacterium sp. VKM Ac-2836]|uniref:shikimate kinase n=1 Tax=Frigoribacterium sp. VKM Ac-2836 TaxID=2739014 RepID=UPI00156735C4|nr:shikimate kinase [Frigoribacterium sp. VKM Ac-2836]NRD25959.1 shikimate kinase [Frigoribacterium sp. VKM Ac-2836]
MGAGKTSIGKKLSRRLGVPFVDSDRLVVRRHGPIADLFETHGEPHFRHLERDAVAEALSGDGVVSLGGGAVLDHRTRASLSGLSVVLLTVSAEAVESRLAGSARPLLQRGGIEAWHAITAERDPVYRALASVVFDTSHRPVSTVVDDIETWLDSERGTV